jgi:hypothetical protein
VLLQTSAALQQARHAAGNLCQQIGDILIRRWRRQLLELGRRTFFGLDENAIGHQYMEMHIRLKR